MMVLLGFRYYPRVPGVLVLVGLAAVYMPCLGRSGQTLYYCGIDEYTNVHQYELQIIQVFFPFGLIALVFKGSLLYKLRARTRLSPRIPSSYKSCSNFGKRMHQLWRARSGDGPTCPKRLSNAYSLANQISCT